MADIYRAVSKVFSRPRPTWTFMRSINPIYELLHEFRLHCHLLENLCISSPPFWQQWFQISRNSKQIISTIVEYGDQLDICLSKITNSSAILRLMKPLKPRPGLSATGFEPGTSRMRVWCVTTEPPRNWLLLNIVIGAFIVLVHQRLYASLIGVYHQHLKRWSHCRLYLTDASRRWGSVFLPPAEDFVQQWAKHLGN